MTSPARAASILPANSTASASIWRNVRRTSPVGAKIAARSAWAASVSSQAETSGSRIDFIPCEPAFLRVDSALVSKHESGRSSSILRDRYRLRVRCRVPYALHPPGHQNRYLCRLSSFFHGRTKVRRYRRPGGEVYPALRQHQSHPRSEVLARLRQRRSAIAMIPSVANTAVYEDGF